MTPTCKSSGAGRADPPKELFAVRQGRVILNIRQSAQGPRRLPRAFVTSPFRNCVPIGKRLINTPCKRQIGNDLIGPQYKPGAVKGVKLKYTCGLPGGRRSQKGAVALHLCRFGYPRALRAPIRHGSKCGLPPGVRGCRAVPGQFRHDAVHRRQPAQPRPAGQKQAPPPPAPEYALRPGNRRGAPAFWGYRRPPGGAYSPNTFL